LLLVLHLPLLPCLRSSSRSGFPTVDKGKLPDPKEYVKLAIRGGKGKECAPTSIDLDDEACEACKSSMEDPDDEFDVSQGPDEDDDEDGALVCCSGAQ
jgi:hypothetical protein